MSQKGEKRFVMRKVTIVSILFVFAALIYGGSPALWQQLTGIEASAQADVADVSTHPHSAINDRKEAKNVNYSNAAIGVAVTEQAMPGTSVAGAVADFDSDGMRDLVVADSSGRLSIFRGNIDTLFPNTPDARSRRQIHGDAKPFISTNVEKYLPIVPEYLFAGDLNGDGFSDIVAANRNADRFYVLMGGGHANFSDPIAFPVGGRITAMAAGEIGRKEQIIDLAIGLESEGRSFVAVYEHPEGTLKHRPELHKIPAPAIAIDLGQLDSDNYSDVAVATVAGLTIIHGRGHPYPLDMVESYGIERPAAHIQSRQLPFSIADIAVGNFGREFGDSIAFLTTDGRIVQFEPDRSVVNPNANRLTADLMRGTSKAKQLPSEEGLREFVTMPEQRPTSPEDAEQIGQLMMETSKMSEVPHKLLDERTEAMLTNRARMSPRERARKDADEARKTEEAKELRKQLFEQRLAAKPIALNRFAMETVVESGRFANAAASQLQSKLVKGRYSASGRDDLAIIDPHSNELHVVGHWNKDELGRGPKNAETATLATRGAASQIVPMRLNPDGLSDMVVLGSNSAAPDVMMSDADIVLVVNSTSESTSGFCDGSEPCGLRRAIEVANFFGGFVVAITFDIPGNGPHTFLPTSPYPAIRRTMIIDGTTQPGYTVNPVIEIDGTNINSSAEGLRIQASNSVVRGLAINKMPAVNFEGSLIAGSGITVVSTNIRPNINNVTIEGNYLGTDLGGSNRKPNAANGIQIYDAHFNTVGGTVSLARNLLSGNGAEINGVPGVGLAITGGHENQIKGNYIGTNVLGNQKVRNSYGMFFAGINNEFGGNEAGAGNVVSGNGGEIDQFGQCAGQGIGVVALFLSATGELVSSDNLIRGNLIGTGAGGNSALGNCYMGIASEANINTLIGSSAESGRNTISDNGYDALHCGFGSFLLYPFGGFCSIVGNNIGTNAAGNQAIPNNRRNQPGGFQIVTDTIWATPTDRDFIVIGSPANTTPDGSCTGMCNLVSGNYSPMALGGNGIWRSGLGGVLIVNNVVGLNRSGTSSLPNGFGIYTFFGESVVGIPLSDGQGGFIFGSNVVAGNRGSGINVEARRPGSHSIIKSNRVGTSTDGISSIGNGVGDSRPQGILGYTAPSTFVEIGGNGPFDKNIIAATTSDLGSMGSQGAGIRVNTYGRSTVFGNWVGLNNQGLPAGNSGGGIVANGNGEARVGGLSQGEGNAVKNNGRAGITVTQFTQGSTVTPAERVTIRGNSIANNGELGIDLMNATIGNQYPSGVTPNDCIDEDTGANTLLNYPELYEPTFNVNVTVPTTLRSKPAAYYVIDYYISGTGDPSNYGEGEGYIGSLDLLTDGNGFAEGTFVSPGPVTAGMKITATTTDEVGNTSEFSCIAGECTTEPFAEAKSRSTDGVTCINPIIVTTTGDEDDPNTSDGVCDVDLETPGEQCTLRAAIQEANARNGFDLVIFNIPGTGIQTINVPTANPLPDIEGEVEINAATQPGYDGSPVVEIRGEVQGTSVPSFGFGIRTSNVTIKGFAINRFGTGIVIGTAARVTNNNVIEGCFIGLNADGTTADPQLASNAGIVLAERSANNRIGGPRFGYIGPNVISNNVAGIIISGSLVRNNRVMNARIGTDKTGNALIGNGIGVIINSFAQDNIIGGDLEAEGNTISGSDSYGISIGTSARLNRIAGNLIGTNSAGTAKIANNIAGITLTSSARENTIGGAPNERNIISGNGGTTDPDVGFGIEINATAVQNTIVGNVIGLSKNEQILGNIVGIGVSGNNNTIGGNQSAPNVISGNRLGVVLGTVGPNPVSNNTIAFNRIGTDVGGHSAAANTVGIAAQGLVSGNGISDNLISGNTTTGIFLSEGVVGVSIGRNRIGTRPDGNSDLPNGAGILISRAQNNSITGNVLSGNQTFGILIGEDNIPELAALRSSIDVVLSKYKRADGSGETSGNSVQGNRVGTNQNGTEAIPNGSVGIVIGENARENTIGGQRSTGYGNIVSGHDQGIGVGIYLGPIAKGSSQDRHPQGNRIQGNRVGLKRNVNELLSNREGIHIEAANNNYIGPEVGSDCDEKGKGTQCDDFGNIVGGSQEDAIKIVGEDASSNVISYNLIGVSPDGTALNNNGNGITVSNAGPTQIIGNTIGNNGENGIEVTGIEKRHAKYRNDLGFFSIVIEKNKIGTIVLEQGSNIAAANQLAGIALKNAASVLVGSLNPDGIKNIIASNNGHGIDITGQDSVDNHVNSTIIGTDDAGTLGLGNGGDGVRIAGGSNNQIGDPSGDEQRATTVSGNQGNGVNLTGGSSLNRVLASSIGVIKVNGGTLRVANQENGVAIDNAAHNALGGGLGNAGNIIAGNLKSGVLVKGLASIQNQLLKNQIGGAGLGNILHGVHITQGANSNSVGGNDPGEGNEIFENGGNGVLIDESEDNRSIAGVPPPVQNRILSNLISNNGSLGIDLGEPGRDDNDGGDPDEGVNRGQNHPELENLHIDSGNHVVVDARVDSHPDNQNYGSNGIRIDLFKSDLFGQGAVYLQSVFWTVSDYNGGGTIFIDLGNADDIGFGPADRLTATATDADGNTSEFFPVDFAPSSSGVEVSGRVMAANGRPIDMARLTLTDQSGNSQTVVTNRFGYFKFESVPAGADYVLAIGHRRYQFAQPSRIISVTDPVTDIEFIAVE